MEEYLSIDALAKRLELSPKTIKNKMAKGVFKLGTHYFRPPGLPVRFKWSAIVGLIEQPQEQPRADTNAIPTPAYYRRTKSLKKTSLTLLTTQAASLSSNGKEGYYHEREGAK